MPEFGFTLEDVIIDLFQKGYLYLSNGHNGMLEAYTADGPCWIIGAQLWGFDWAYECNPAWFPDREYVAVDHRHLANTRHLPFSHVDDAISWCQRKVFEKAAEKGLPDWFSDWAIVE